MTILYNFNLTGRYLSQYSIEIIVLRTVQQYKKPNTILFPYYFYILDNKNLNIFNLDYHLFIFYLINIQSFIIKL
jgi:hypothetical protein